MLDGESFGEALVEHALEEAWGFDFDSGLVYGGIVARRDDVDGGDEVGVADGECGAGDFDEAFFRRNLDAVDACNGGIADAFAFDADVDDGVSVDFLGFFHEVRVDDARAFNVGSAVGERVRFGARRDLRFVDDDLNGFVVFHGDGGVLRELCARDDAVLCRRFDLLGGAATRCECDERKTTEKQG